MINRVRIVEKQLYKYKYNGLVNPDKSLDRYIAEIKLVLKFKIKN